MMINLLAGRLAGTQRSVSYNIDSVQPKQRCFTDWKNKYGYCAVLLDEIKIQKFLFSRIRLCGSVWACQLYAALEPRYTSKYVVGVLCSCVYCRYVRGCSCALSTEWRSWVELRRWALRQGADSMHLLWSCLSLMCTISDDRRHWCDFPLCRQHSPGLLCLLTISLSYADEYLWLR